MTEKQPEPVTEERPESPRAPTTGELVVDFVKVRFWSLVIVGIVGLTAAFYVGVEPEIPRFWKIAIASGVFVLPVGYLTAQKVIDLLYDPSWIWLLDLSAAEEKGGLYRFSESDFREIDVLDGELDRLAPGLFVGKRVQKDDLKVAGTWRGTLTDRELLISLRKVRECRGQLEEDARQGFVLRSSAFTIVRRAVRNTTLSVVETFERGTLPDSGEAMGAAIDAELEEFGISDDLDEAIDEMIEEMQADSAEDDDGRSFVFDAEPEPANGSEPLTQTND